MIKVIGGGVGRVIYRTRSTRRSKKRGPLDYSVDFSPPTLPDTVYLLYVNKALQFRKYTMFRSSSPQICFDMAERLVGNPAGFPFGGWVLNEQVAPQMTDVVLV